MNENISRIIDKYPSQGALLKVFAFLHGRAWWRRCLIIRFCAASHKHVCTALPTQWNPSGPSNGPSTDYCFKKQAAPALHKDRANQEREEPPGERLGPLGRAPTCRKTT